MKNIKVFLQYPWKSPDSSYYKNILDYPPGGIEYINHSNRKKVEVIGSSKNFETMRKVKNAIRKILGILKIPNLIYTREKDIDLIHCAHCLSLNKKPWVVDTETYDRIAATGSIAFSPRGKKIIQKKLESPYCKKIITWSDDCKKTFEKAFPNNQKILAKITILPFGALEPPFKKKTSKKLTVLFVARWFEAKGGLQTLHVFNSLAKKYPKVRFLFICPIPKRIKRDFLKKKEKNVILKDLVPQKILFEKIYPETDIFFYPGFGDSYGFAVPEVMAYGIPIVSSNTFAKNEQIINGKNGFLINIPDNFRDFYDYSCMDRKMLQKFEEKLELLIKDKKLRTKMGKESKKIWKKKFSIKERNKKLKKIYEEALKS